MVDNVSDFLSGNLSVGDLLKDKNLNDLSPDPGNNKEFFIDDLSIKKRNLETETENEGGQTFKKNADTNAETNDFDHPKGDSIPGFNDSKKNNDDKALINLFNKIKKIKNKKVSSALNAIKNTEKKEDKSKQFGYGKGKIHPQRRFKNKSKDPILGITLPAIRRLARRGGVKRISKLIYDETRANLKFFLRSVINKAIIYTESARRKTVTTMDVVYALKTIGKKLFGFN